MREISRMAALVIAGAVIAAGCSPKNATPEAVVDRGTVERGVYSNTFFDMKMHIAAGWIVQDHETHQQIGEDGINRVAGDNEDFKAVAAVTTEYLFAAFKNMGKTGMPGPSIMVVAERVSHLPDIKRGKDYHVQSKKALEAGEVKFSFPADIYEEKVGGLTFDVQTLQLESGGTTMHQKHFATVMKGYVLLIGITYYGDEGEDELMQMVNSIKFGGAELEGVTPPPSPQ